MNDFKVGDEVWFMTTGDYYIVGLNDVVIYKAWVCDEENYNGEFELESNETCVQGTCKELPWVNKIKTILLYKSKQECIEAFKKRLDEL